MPAANQGPILFETAIQDALEIEFALTFDAPQGELQNINEVHRKSSPATTESQTLQKALEQIT